MKYIKKFKIPFRGNGWWCLIALDTDNRIYYHTRITYQEIKLVLNSHNIFVGGASRAFDPDRHKEIERCLKG